MKILSVIASACLILLVASSPSGAQDVKQKILGKWETTKKDGDVVAKITLDFQKDGKVKMAISADAGGMKIENTEEATYKWADKDHLEITAKDPGGKEKTEKFTIKKLDDKELVLSVKMEGEKEEEMKFTRVK